MSVRQAWVVFRKEIVDGVRDRATVTTVVLQAVSSPLVYGVIVMVVAGREAQPTLTLPVAGGEHAPALVQWLEGQPDVDVVAHTADPLTAVLARDTDLVLVIPENFGTLTARGLTANVGLVNRGKGASLRAAERTRALLGVYSTGVASQRLVARGIAPAVVMPIAIEDVDVSDPPRGDSGFLFFIPILLLWLALSAGGAMALDSTVGERERGSLEPLLLNPVPRSAIVTGKWLATSTFACASVVAAVAATLVALHWIPWHEYGMQMQLRDRDVVVAGLVILPLGVLMGAVLMLVSASARSLQQAHTYLAVVVMTVVMLAMASFLFELSDVPWTAPVPIAGQLAIVTDVLNGSSPSAARYVLSALGPCLAALLLILVTAKLLRRESIVFRS